MKRSRSQYKIWLRSEQRQNTYYAVKVRSGNLPFGRCEMCGYRPWIKYELTIHKKRDMEHDSIPDSEDIILLCKRCSRKLAKEKRRNRKMEYLSARKKE